MTRSFIVATLIASPLFTVTLPAHAEDAGGPSVSVVRAQFAEKIEDRLPTGDATSVAPGKVATYWVEVSNPGESTDVTLVWKLDGKETARQSLEVGRAPHWRTWGMCNTRNAHTVDVEILDKDGHSLKTDSVTL
jgi:hypothetical protein